MGIGLNRRYRPGGGPPRGRLEHVASCACRPFDQDPAVALPAGHACQPAQGRTGTRQATTDCVVELAFCSCFFVFCARSPFQHASVDGRARRRALELRSRLGRHQAARAWAAVEAFVHLPLDTFADHAFLRETPGNNMKPRPLACRFLNSARLLAPGLVSQSQFQQRPRSFKPPLPQGIHASQSMEAPPHILLSRGASHHGLPFRMFMKGRPPDRISTAAAPAPSRCTANGRR